MISVEQTVRRTYSVEETEKVAERFAGVLTPGDWIGLVGPLGAGKSVFARVVGRAFGVRELMPSPTYTLMNCLPGRVPVYHIDLYRLASVDELDFAGITPYFQGDGICLVEWADRIPSYWPENGWVIRIQILGDHQREISIARHRGNE